MLTINSPGKKILNPFPPNDKSHFVNMFEFIGTADNAPFLCISDALKWRESIGGEVAIREYCVDLAQKAARRVADMLGTEYIENAEGTLGQCFMSNVNLPLNFDEVRKTVENAGKVIDDIDLQYKIRDWMTIRIVEEHNAFTALGFHNGMWYVRLSATVYLDMDDFEKGGRILIEECERVKKGEFLHDI
jgi:hercynylcysteine S-oxide lyase